MMSRTISTAGQCPHLPGNRIQDVNGLEQCKWCGCILAKADDWRVKYYSFKTEDDDLHPQGKERFDALVSLACGSKQEVDTQDV